MTIGIGTEWTALVQNTVAGNKINQQLSKDLDKADDTELLEACRQFEAYFIESLFKQMRSSVGESTLFPTSQGTKIFEDMLYQQYSEEAAKGSGIGIAKMLYEQMKLTGIKTL